jgi:hypothetical protein
MAAASETAGEVAADVENGLAKPLKRTQRGTPRELNTGRRSSIPPKEKEAAEEREESNKDLVFFALTASKL